MPGRAASILLCRCTSVIAVAAALAAPASAEDLLQVYRDAQRYDAVYAAARFTLEAGRERIPQGRALVLPTLNLTGNVTQQRVEIGSSNSLVIPTIDKNPVNTNYTFTLTQPLYRPQNFAQRDQAEYQVRQSEAIFAQA